MIIRKCLLSLAVAAVVAGSVGRANAFAPPPPVVAGTSVGAGVYVAGGFIGFVGALCIYDIILKIQGIKNWDGTAKVVPHARHH